MWAILTRLHGIYSEEHHREQTSRIIRYSIRKAFHTLFQNAWGLLGALAKTTTRYSKIDVSTLDSNDIRPYFGSPTITTIYHTEVVWYKDMRAVPYDMQGKQIVHRAYKLDHHDTTAGVDRTATTDPIASFQEPLYCYCYNVVCIEMVAQIV